MKSEAVHSKPRVLHVDDDKDFLDLFACKFREYLEITSALDSEAALEILNSGNFDVVITDYELPGKNGIELLKAIKIKHPKVSVIFYTRRENDLIAHEAFASGADDYFTKDIHGIAHSEKLMNSIRRCQETKKALLERDASKERLEQALEAFNDSLYDWNITTGKVYYSPNCYTMLGYTPGEFPLSYDVWVSLLHPEDRDNAVRVTKDYLEGKIQVYEIEFRIKTKSGQWKWMHGRGKIVERDDNGSPLRIVGSHTDISDRKTAEEALIFERNLFALIAETSPVGIVLYNRDGKVMFANKQMENLLHISRSKLIDSLFDDTMFNMFTASGERVPRSELLFSLVKTQKCPIFGVNQIYITPEGKEVFLSMNGAPLFSESVGFDGIIGTSEDITKRKKIEQQLINKNRELDDFAHRVSHDLKAPVNMIYGYLSVLNDDPEHYQKYYSKAIHQTENLIHSINRLLNLSRAGKVLGSKEEIKLEALIKKILWSMKTNEIHPELIISSPLPDILGDMSGIEQLFANLIDNSIKYHDPDKKELHIKIWHKIQDGRIRIFYKDNGLGVAQEHLEEIFKPGFTVKKETGTGFGLAISKKIAGAHGGNITANSKGLHQGMEFVIDLPHLI